MISFKLEEEQEIVRDAMRDFAGEAMRPIARECDEASAVSDEFLEQTWELGLVSTQIPEAYGGAGEARSVGEGRSRATISSSRRASEGRAMS